MTINEKIKYYRIYSGMTQEELSNKTGISLLSIKKFENGKDIKLSNFIKIINALDLSSKLELLVPNILDRPSIDPKKIRKKAYKKKRNNNFKWGDEK